MSASDPGQDLRYTVEFTDPAELLGKKFSWATMPVKLRYNKCAVSGCTAGIENAAKKGIEFWQKNATLFGEIQTAYGEPPDVQIDFIAAFTDETIGRCKATVLENKQTKRYYLATPLTITLSTTTFQGKPLTERDIEFVTAHEMGHCLGLWTHSPRNGDLMYGTLTDQTKYSNRDLNSIRWLYSHESDLLTYPSSALSIGIEPIAEILSPPLSTRP